jgi:hypothetical protein
MASAASSAAALLRASLMADKLMNSGGFRPPSAPDAPLAPAQVTKSHKRHGTDEHHSIIADGQLESPMRTVHRSHVVPDSYLRHSYCSGWLNTS